VAGVGSAWRGDPGRCRFPRHRRRAAL